MKKIINITSLLFIILFILQISPLQAQHDLLFHGSKHKLGFVSGIGGQDFHQILNVLYGRDANSTKANSNDVDNDPDQTILQARFDYQVVYFQLQYYYAVLQKKSWGLDILAQPQYNVTQFRFLDDETKRFKGYEYGLNIGLLIRKNILSDKLGFYAFLSSGPHYVSGVPERQSGGFIFSDNFFMGANVKVIKNIYLDSRIGIRHISNAGIKEPNAGVNNLIISGGFFILLGKNHKKI